VGVRYMDMVMLLVHLHFHVSTLHGLDVPAPTKLPHGPALWTLPLCTHSPTGSALSLWPVGSA
jgi:hypothetical protein